jgi:CBS domain-containing protein
MLKELETIAEDLGQGRPIKPVTVRQFLEWFGVQRRGYNIVQDIRGQLEEAGLTTDPDFESAWLDGPIGFRSKDTVEAKLEIADVADATPSKSEVASSVPETVISWVTRDATYRISKLAAANLGVVSVNPDAPLSEAVTLMMSRNYSQLPVMTGERSVRGIISWMSIGSRLALGLSGSRVQDLMQQAHEVKNDTSIFDAILLIVRHGYVLVRNDTQKVTGIVTASDLSLQFQTLTEPFLLLSEIENLLRNMIGKRFSVPQLLEARDPGADSRAINTVADLTIGEYIRLLQKQDRWILMGLAIDKVIFCNDLDKIRKIRNRVLHFDPDGIEPPDLEALRDFAGFLKQLEETGCLQ